MSKGIKISHHNTDEELESLRGVRALQITTPSKKYFGFEIRNFDTTITSIDKLPGDKIEIKLDGVDESLVLYSAVVTYELTGLSAITEFGKEQ